MAKKHYPPSRKKYDQQHPTISIRVNQQLYEQLKELRETTGKSLGDILREALKAQKPSAKRAFDLGYSAAKSRYSVEYRCSVCGGTLVVDSEQEKRAIAQYMREYGWRHTSCGS